MTKKRDPNMTIRNKRALELKSERRVSLPNVLKATGYESEASLNAKIGFRYSEYCEVRTKQYVSPDIFHATFLSALRKKVLSISPHKRSESLTYELAKHWQRHSVLRDYVKNLSEFTYLKNYDAYSRPKPPLDTALWLGQNNANYGLFITPRFNASQAAWENDKSEVRKAKFTYFTINHILNTGLCVPDKNEIMEFANTSEYLKFFKNVLVRSNASIHQSEIADRYATYVLNADKPLEVPLLLPELRYLGKAAKHEYRLDYAIVDPYTFKKVGFELSPWSSHGYLKNTKTMKAGEINKEARGNFEKECKKIRDHFVHRGISVIIFTDNDLENYDGIFADISKYLNTKQREEQLEFQATSELLSTDLDAEIAD
jgi:hypothetical protein